MFCIITSCTYLLRTVLYIQSPDSTRYTISSCKLALAREKPQTSNLFLSLGARHNTVKIHNWPTPCLNSLFLPTFQASRLPGFQASRLPPSTFHPPKPPSLYNALLANILPDCGICGHSGIRAFGRSGIWAFACLRVWAFGHLGCFCYKHALCIHGEYTTHGLASPVTRRPSPVARRPTAPLSTNNQQPTT
ncbi:hypothetical protein K504DRAFT_275960 [Pleomassaria siparia CBS 279.74]|uniref:Uncharacterized protein n=1 Tax=Pleomassaria siparia CBS 279.74 TaxID=1314801 RepID=A0A6G1K9C9_9PLEO|nr:hypothetical protein K504DRAFT_275960 [Pleomassaria siparia CBS 279.74]